MAYVAISRDLVNDVDHNLRSMWTAESNAAVNTSNLYNQLSENTDLQNSAIGLLWAGFEDIRDRLEPHNRQASIRCYVRGYDEDGSSKEVTVARFGSKRVPCIAHFEGYSRDSVQVDVTDIQHPAVVQYLEAVAVQKEIEVRWTKVREQVKKFLQASKSLNEAVKLWPDVRRYIPSEYLRRIDQKTEKKVKEVSAAMEALKAIDLDAVAASTVLARMAGASI